MALVSVAAHGTGATSGPTTSSWTQATTIDILLQGEIVYTLKEAKLPVEQWRIRYNTVPPHSLLGYRPPAPQAINLLVTPAPAAQQ